MMYQDEIVEEIHKIREEYSRAFNHDLKAIFADLQKQQAESGREVITLPRKRGITTRWSGKARDLSGEAEDTSLRAT
jgi:predicted PolB exonuclease-like 3'-5' exonuclease